MKLAQQAMPWTEMSLDPEVKPATPANKSRAAARTLGSDVKLPAPVGSGRNKSTVQETTAEPPKMQTYSASEGGNELWKGMPMKLSLPTPSLADSQSENSK